MFISSTFLCFSAMPFLALVYWLDWSWMRRHVMKMTSDVSGLPTVSLLDNVLLFIAKSEEQLNKITELTEKYGQYMKFWVGPDMNICVKNPADVKLLLTSNKINKKGPVYRFLAPFIGEGIVTGGSTWRAHRKTITPSYNKKSVQMYNSIFNKEGEELAKILRNKDPSVTFNVYFDVLFTTTQCVCQTLMGLSKEDSLSIKYLEEIIYGAQRLYSLIFARMTRWWLHIPIIYKLCGGEKEVNNYIAMVDAMAKDILEKKRVALKIEPPVDSAISAVDRCLLREVTEEDLRLETFATFTTSQESSAKITSAVLLALAHLPEWQDKVVNEIYEVLEPDDQLLTEKQLKGLLYLDMVYKETLRYLPIAPLIQRIVEEDITINNGKITLPVGTSLVIPIFAIHRDPQFWEEPYKFKPERFLPENVKKQDPNAFIPFSLGAMDCLGRTYATTLVKSLIVKVLREVQLEADGKLEDLQLNVAISTHFTDGCNLRVRPRQRNNIIAT